MYRTQLYGFLHVLFFTLQIAHSKRDLSLVLVRATHAYGSPRRNADAVTLFWPFQVQMCSLSLLFASDNGQARDSDLTTAVECMCNALRTRPDSFRAHGSTTRTRLLLVDSGDRDQENCMRVRSGYPAPAILCKANGRMVNATQQRAQIFERSTER